MQCPKLQPALIVADDARLAARLSAVLSRPGGYLAVVDGPRMSRPDADNEVIRRNNVAARIQPELIAFAGVDPAVVEAFSFAKDTVVSVSTHEEVDRLESSVDLATVPLVWGTENIGLGLLRALRSRRTIHFSANAGSPIDPIPTKSGHIVVCEKGNELSEVIAANYAYALDAGLLLIPEVPLERIDEIMERFYSLYDDRERAPNDILLELNEHLRQICGDLPFAGDASVTFVTRGLPYGAAFPEAPSTHLFTYPDLGISVVNGFAAEQPNAMGVESAVLVDPSTTDAPEIPALARILSERKIFVRGYSGPTANVRDVQNAIEWFPYDFLLIATHCGDPPGYRWTYEFRDSNGRDRRLVVDVCIGIARTDDPDMFHVTQQNHFRELDGIDWHDPQKQEKLEVGTAITDWIALTQADQLEPILKEELERVVGGTVLKMFDDNYLPVPRPVANMGSPIIVNNACVSWHNIAKTFVFAGARLYVGTLITVTTTEASEIVTRAIGKHYGKSLPHAFWSAQREVYGPDSVRRPYIVTGIYPQHVRGSRRDVPAVLERTLRRSAVYWSKKSEEAFARNDPMAKSIAEIADYFTIQSSAFTKKWGSRSAD